MIKILNGFSWSSDNFPESYSLFCHTDGHLLVHSKTKAMISLSAGAIFVVVYIVVQGLLSPLSKLPGPWYTRFTSLWLKYQEFTANRRESIHRLHQAYGPVVRLAPDEVSFTSLDAIKEIYASGGSGYDKTELYSLFKQFKTRSVTAIYFISSPLT